MVRKSTHISNFLSFGRRMPALSAAARVANVPALRELRPAQRREVTGVVARAWLNAGVLRQGRVIPSQMETAAGIAESAIKMASPEGVPIGRADVLDALFFSRSNVPRAELPHLNALGAWTAFNLLVRPRELEEIVSRPRIEAPQDEVRASAEEAQFVEFTREIYQMIHDGVEYETFINRVCQILHQTSGLERCIALMFNEAENALVAEGRAEIPNRNPWASASMDNTAKIIAFLRDPDGVSRLKIPVDAAGQKQTAQDLALRVLRIIVNPLHEGWSVATRVARSFGAVIRRGKLILPQNFNTAQAEEAESIFTQCYKMGKTLVVNDTSKPEHPISRPLVAMWRSKTFIVVPVKIGEKVVGVFGMDHDLGPKKISRVVQHRVEALAEMASIGLSMYEHANKLEAQRGTIERARDKLAEFTGPELAQAVIDGEIAGLRKESGTILGIRLPVGINYAGPDRNQAVRTILDEVIAVQGGRVNRELVGDRESFGEAYRLVGENRTGLRNQPERTWAKISKKVEGEAECVYATFTGEGAELRAALAAMQLQWRWDAYVKGRGRRPRPLLVAVTNGEYTAEPTFHGSREARECLFFTYGSPPARAKDMLFHLPEKTGILIDPALLSQVDSRSLDAVVEDLFNQYILRRILGNDLFEGLINLRTEGLGEPHMLDSMFACSVLYVTGFADLLHGFVPLSGREIAQETQPVGFDKDALAHQDPAVLDIFSVIGKLHYAILQFDRHRYLPSSGRTRSNWPSDIASQFDLLRNRLDVSAFIRSFQGTPAWQALEDRLNDQHNLPILQRLFDQELFDRIGALKVEMEGVEVRVIAQSGEWQYGIRASEISLSAFIGISVHAANAHDLFDKFFPAELPHLNLRVSGQDLEGFIRGPDCREFVTRLEGCLSWEEMERSLRKMDLTRAMAGLASPADGNEILQMEPLLDSQSGVDNGLHTPEGEKTSAMVDGERAPLYGMDSAEFEMHLEGAEEGFVDADRREAVLEYQEARRDAREAGEPPPDGVDFTLPPEGRRKKDEDA